MYIQPSSTIYLLNNIPLDSRNLDTFSWASIAEQQAYFLSRVKRTFTSQTYARHEKGLLRLQALADDIYDCNYVMFQNSSFGTKWFYGFINSVEYVNNKTSDISFTMDPLQTWYFETSFSPCFVERMHSATDAIGDNILPEPVDPGELVYNNYHLIAGEYSIGIVVISIIEVNQETSAAASADVHSYEGVISGSTLWAYRADDITNINAKIQEYIQSPDSIIGMYMVPPFILPGGPPEVGGYQVQDNSVGTTTGITITPITDNSTLDGYTPKNKKLLTYPFNMFVADNSNGANITLRYEFCDDLRPRFNMYGTLTMPVEVVLRPSQYKGTAGQNQTMSLTLNNYPMCSWNVDTFKAWVAQNSVPIVGSAAVGVGSAIIGAVTGNLGLVAGGINSLFDTASKAVSEGYQASIKPDMGKGNFNNGGANYGHGFQAFYGGRMSMKAQNAEMVDNFLEAFGYAQKTIMTPNRRVRPHWTYIKTAGCIIRGTIPEDDRAAIASIHDAGIRYWSNGVIGDFSLDNSPA